MLDIYFPIFCFSYGLCFGESSPKTLFFQLYFTRSLFRKCTCDGVNLESKRQLVHSVLHDLIRFLVRGKMFLVEVTIGMLGNDDGHSELV